ncbi:MAG: Yip1 family protein [Candidatus Aquicultor sp.]|nr:Yip1 family protein [Candidatus Aquicultor sp.]
MYEDDTNGSGLEQPPTGADEHKTDAGTAANNLSETTAEPGEASADAKSIDATGGETPTEEESPSELEKRTVTELLYGVIVKPVATLRYVAERRLIWASLLIYITIAWLGAIASIPGSLNSFEQLPNMGALPALFNPRSIIIFTVVGTPFFSVFSMFISAGILHIIALPLKGKGAFWGLFSVIGFAGFPSIMATPFGLLDYFTGFGTSLYALITLPFTIWTIVLTIIGIRENYNFSTARAVWTFFIPLITLFLLVMLLVIGIIALFVGALSGQ